MSAASRPQAIRTRPSTGARPVGSTSHQPLSSQTSKMAWKSGGLSWWAKALTARAEAWRPWRGYAVFHLWREASASTPTRAATPTRTRARSTRSPSP